MREIKFRGITNEFSSPSWVYGDLICDCTDEPRIMTDYHDCYEPVTWMVDPATVGQYTGVKDINGKESYEGDIIKFYDDRAHELVGVIKWNSLVCRWYVDCSVSGSDCVYHVFDARYAFEILGNVYDNRELLEGEDA